MTDKIQLRKAGRHNNYHYNRQLKGKARYLRNHMTKAEICLWKLVLSNKEMLGYNFSRQRPVLNYIVDFMCKELMLIIEIDGYTHTFEDIFLKDEKKQKDLERIGFRVLRYRDEDVLKNIHSVITDIENTINDIME